MTGVPAVQRSAMGALSAVFGLMHILPALFVLLSSVGPAPALVSARVWSLFFFVHFLTLVASGYLWLLADSVRTRLFHGGPFIDFTLVLTGFILISSVSGLLLGKGSGPSWPALLPGLFLAAMGLRLRNGRALLGRALNKDLIE